MHTEPTATTTRPAAAATGSRSLLPVRFANGTEARCANRDTHRAVGAKRIRHEYPGLSRDRDRPSFRWQRFLRTHYSTARPAVRCAFSKSPSRLFPIAFGA